MSKFKIITVIIFLVLQLSGCIGLDIIGTRTSSSGMEKEIYGAEKTTVTKDGLKWTGAIVSLIVPIPLIIPYGRETETKWEKNGEEVYRTNTDTASLFSFGCMFFYFCGYGWTVGNIGFADNLH